MRWKEEQLVEVQDEDEEEEEDDGRVEIPGFPPVTLDIPALHREGGKQGRLSRASQQSQTDSPVESILRTRDLSKADQGQSQPVEEQHLIKSTRENSTSTSLFQDFISSLGRRSPKESEKDDNDTDIFITHNGEVINKQELSDNNANESQKTSEIASKDNEINKALLESSNAQQSKAVNEPPPLTRRLTFDEDSLASPSRHSRLGSSDVGTMPVVNLLPK